MAKKSQVQANRDAYLRQLEEHPQHDSREVIRSLGLLPYHITEMRKSRDFVAKEVAICEGHPIGAASLPRIRELQVQMTKDAFLEAFKKHEGVNVSAACREAGITRKEHEALVRNDPEFRDAMDAICREIGEELQEVSVGMAKRDPQHMRWKLAKLIPDKYADKPKEINLRYSGKLTIDSINAEIDQLESGDDLDLLEVP